MFWRVRGIAGDRVLLAIAHTLTAVGFAIMVSRADPLRDVALFVRFAQGVLAGLAVLAVVSQVNVRTALLRHFSYLPLAAAIAALGRADSLWQRAVGQHGQGEPRAPAADRGDPDAARDCFSLGTSRAIGNCCAPCRKARWAASTCRAGCNVPRVRYVVPVLLGVAAVLALFFLQKDLGPALMLAVVFLAIYGTARGRPG